jgi:hypothetical protein
VPASDALWQEYPGAQSEAVAQPTLHAAFAQACGVQSIVVPVTHAPAPSHFEVPTRRAVPGVQVAAAQVVPAIAGAQVPAPLMLQAKQVPQELLMQQTPSVHMVLAHSVPAVQVVPLALRFVQVPEMQL